MRNVRTVILAAVSRRDLYYVSENESFCFGQKNLVQGRAGGPQVLGIRGPEKNREQKVGSHMRSQIFPIRIEIATLKCDTCTHVASA